MLPKCWPLTLGLPQLVHSLVDCISGKTCCQLCIDPFQVPRVKARHNMAEKVQLFSSIVGGPEWHQQTELASQDDDQDKAASE